MHRLGNCAQSTCYSITIVDVTIMDLVLDLIQSGVPAVALCHYKQNAASIPFDLSYMDNGRHILVNSMLNVWEECT